MRFRMLGPLRVRNGVAWVPVTAEQQRMVLAVLLANAGEVVSTQRLMNAVWGDRLPRRAVNTVQAYVMRLRRLLGDGVITTTGRGYQLVVSRDDVDALVFERLVAAGRRGLDHGHVPAGATRLAKALALWHGPVFADVPASPSLAVRVAQLEQARLAAEDDHIAALIDLDQHAKVAHQLYRLVEEDPLRERRWVLLMRTLDRCGRRAEALETYHRARRVLRDELGLEPGRQLRDLQRAILTGRASGTADTPVLPAQPWIRGSECTGSDGHPAWLDLMRPAHDGEATVVVISAMDNHAGAGGAAVAVHWAHRVRDRLRDGRLHMDLRGHAQDVPVRPLEALARSLRAIGVPPDQIPSDVDTASAP